ncbi:MAG: glycosyltransferase [Candidatus Eremiobacteraeota bacterium]|nr:glycosyltransferase [Candidatus Eremiobacteraeota bacterium]MBV8374117.1 glycosyltransferase [Candidatus Eremiobacteraeota bacterium]
MIHSSGATKVRATIQLCTYNRAALLERVLDACFEQTIPSSSYEIVLVDDGSTDDTAEMIERVKERSTCELVVVRQSNSGLAKGRNAGIARARGERIIFIDDDVLPLPPFVEEHLRSHASHLQAIVRGGAINVESFDDLPPPVWSIKNYSGNYFWTTNVSLPLQTIRSIGGFNETFSEYGWEDIDVGLRLRANGVKAVFNPQALVYHCKPRPERAKVAAMVEQARAQARTAVKLARLHPHWRAYLATGINPVERFLHALTRRARLAQRIAQQLGGASIDRELNDREVRAARALAREAYFEELERALQASSRD